MHFFKFPYRRLWDPVAAAPGYLWSWKWFICLPYSSMRLMLLIGKTYNPYLVWNQPYQSGSIWNQSYHFVSLIRQKNFTSPRIFFKVKKMKCLSNDLKRIKKWFSCIFKNFRIADFGTQQPRLPATNGLGNGSYVFPIHLWDSCYWLVKPTTPTWSEINRIKVVPYGTNRITSYHLSGRKISQVPEYFSRWKKWNVSQMIWNELKNDFHAFLKISVSPTLGPSSRGSRLLMVLEMVHMSSLFIYETHVIDW